MKFFDEVIAILFITVTTKTNGQYLGQSRILEGAGIQRRDYGFPPTSVRDFFTPKSSSDSFGQDVGPSLERDIGQDFGQDIGTNLRTDIGPYNGQHSSGGLDPNYREGVLSGPSNYEKLSDYGSGSSGHDDFSRRNGYPYSPPQYHNRQPVDSRSAYYGGHFGQPTGAADHTGPHDYDSDRSLTAEEVESKKHNPVPFFINPLIRRGTQGLQRFEANFIRDPKRNQLVKPLLALLTNPSKKR